MVLLYAIVCTVRSLCEGVILIRGNYGKKLLVSILTGSATSVLCSPFSPVITERTISGIFAVKMG